MDKKSYESYEWYLDQLTPEQIAASGGREKIIAALKKNENKITKGMVKSFFRNLIGDIWFLVKGAILILTALYFINAIFF